MEHLLELHNLTRTFGGLVAVKDVDLRVKEGTLHSLIGPNGAGKSTLFGLITGEHRPTRGSISFQGRDITGRPPHVISRRGLARAFQQTNIFPRLTVLESVQVAVLSRQRRTWNVLSWQRKAALDEALEVIELVGLAEAARAESRTLSHGDQRALEVALALATEPRLLLLDEPTAGMSPWETERMAELMRSLVESGRVTVLLSEHDVDVVFGISDVITVMHRGAVVTEGPPADIRAHAEVIQIYLGA